MFKTDAWLDDLSCTQRLWLCAEVNASWWEAMHACFREKGTWVLYCHECDAWLAQWSRQNASIQKEYEWLVELHALLQRQSKDKTLQVPGLHWLRIGDRYVLLVTTLSWVQHNTRSESVHQAHKLKAFKTYLPAPLQRLFLGALKEAFAWRSLCSDKTLITTFEPASRLLDCWVAHPSKDRTFMWRADGRSTATKIEEHALPTQRKVGIIGTGLSGALLAYLLSRSSQVEVVMFEQGPTLATGASALPFGLMHPHWQAIYHPSFELTLLGTRAMQALLRQFTHCYQKQGIWETCKDEGLQQQRLMAWNEQKPFPLDPRYVRYVKASEGRPFSGIQTSQDGFWYELGAVVGLGQLCRSLIEESRATVYSRTKASVGWNDSSLMIEGHWACATQATLIERVDALVVCAGPESLSCLNLHELAPQLEAIAGRISILDHSFSQLSAGLTGMGYVVSVDNVFSGVGATFESMDEPWTRTQAHQHNLEKLSHWQLQAKACSAYEGVRAVMQDRLPVAGAIALSSDIQAKTFKGVPDVDDLPTHPHLWMLFGLGSRGMSWGLALAGHVACQMLYGSSPLPKYLQQAIHPNRLWQNYLKSQKDLIGHNSV